MAIDRRAEPLYYGGRLPGAVWLTLQIGQSNIPSGTQATLMITVGAAPASIRWVCTVTQHDGGQIEMECSNLAFKRTPVLCREYFIIYCAYYGCTWIQSLRFSSPPERDGAGVTETAGCLRELRCLRFSRASCFSSSEIVSHSDRCLRRLGCLLQPDCLTPVCLPDPSTADLPVAFLPAPVFPTAARVRVDGWTFILSGRKGMIGSARPSPMNLPTWTVYTNAFMLKKPSKSV